MYDAFLEDIIQYSSLGYLLLFTLLSNKRYRKQYNCKSRKLSRPSDLFPTPPRPPALLIRRNTLITTQRGNVLVINYVMVPKSIAVLT